MKFISRLIPSHGGKIYCLLCQKKIQLIIGFIFVQMMACAQQLDSIHLFAYNLLNYPDNAATAADTTLRNPFYRTIFSNANPDILVVEELNSEVGMNIFLTNVLNANANNYSAGTFLDGPDTDNGIFYKSSKFIFLDNKAIQTDLRTINEFSLIHLLSGDTIRIYAVHLKASSGTANEAQRAVEADSLRKVTNALPAGSNFIVCGDFNFYASSESAYQKLLAVQPANEGHFIDPIVMSGTWNNSAYAMYHTQSTRTRSFGGGSNGGVDDRFDMIMYSQAIQQAGGMNYVPNSCLPYGNDGLHYNDSINKQPNNSVPVAVANALHNASDHLPIRATFTFEYGTVQQLDAGIMALVSPSSQNCVNSDQPLTISIKNFSTSTLDFANHPLDVRIHAIDPNSLSRTFTQTISSGSLGAGAVMTFTFDSLYTMNLSGSYSFTGGCTLSGDVNTANDTLMQANAQVSASPAVSVAPSGPLMICSGTKTLTATSGLSYLWTNGAATSSISVSDTGQYAVTITVAGGCTATSAPVRVYSGGVASSATLFNESMGSVFGTTLISFHESANGFDNDSLTMSGTGDVRNTSSSLNKYPVASGGANIFLTNTIGKNFIISGINTSGLNNIQLSFGVFKGSTAANGSELQVMVSTDGVNYSSLSFSALSTASADWTYRTATGAIPATSNLRIQFRQNGTASSYRIDDVSLTYSAGNPVITSSGSSVFCQGDSVILTSSPGSFYLWNTGETTQSISVNSSGNYTVEVSCAVSAPFAVTVNPCQTFTLNLKAFIEGFYLGNQSMNAVIDPVVYPLLCDTITVLLAESTSPYAIVASDRNVLSIDGNGQFSFTGLNSGSSYYVIVRHRNSLETWSSGTISFTNSIASFDFTTSSTQAFGNNLKNVNGDYCIFSGDVSGNAGLQDGVVDGYDFDSIESEAATFQTGYRTADLNGDRIVESVDYSFIENQCSNYIFLLKP